MVALYNRLLALERQRRPPPPADVPAEEPTCGLQPAAFAALFADLLAAGQELPRPLRRDELPGYWRPQHIEEFRQTLCDEGLARLVGDWRITVT
jgi:hypothetical protein